MISKRDFEALYQKYYTMVYYTAMQLMGDKNDAEDMTQEAFVTAFVKYANLQDEAAFGGWIKRIVINKCLDEQKKKTPVPVEDIETELMGEMTDDENVLPEDVFISEEKRKIIFDIMKSVLSKKQYETVVLFYYDELPIAEIAQMMDVPEGTIRSRLSIARNKIEKGVLEYEEKHHEKLYSSFIIPFLGRLFAEESEQYVPPVEVPMAIQECIVERTASMISKTAVAENVARGVAGAKIKIIASSVAVVIALTLGGLVTKKVTEDKKKMPGQDNNTEYQREIEDTQRGIEIVDNQPGPTLSPDIQQESVPNPSPEPSPEPNVPDSIPSHGKIPIVGRTIKFDEIEITLGVSVLADVTQNGNKGWNTMNTEDVAPGESKWVFVAKMTDNQDVSDAPFSQGNNRFYVMNFSEDDLPIDKCTIIGAEFVNSPTVNCPEIDIAKIHFGDRYEDVIQKVGDSSISSDSRQFLFKPKRAMDIEVINFSEEDGTVYAISVVSGFDDLLAEEVK